MSVRNIFSIGPFGLIYFLISLTSLLLQVNITSAQSLYFERVFDQSLAQASYVIGNLRTGDAIVIDAKRDIDTYLRIAEANQLTITHITETHIHADFLSGSRELAAATGAQLYLSGEGSPDWQYEFDHKPLKDGDQIKLSNISLEIMHTPGHTPESITFLIRDTQRPWDPIKAITGDFIFVGDVGRPDLLEKAAGQIGTQETGAKQLYASINRFKQLPTNTEIWPGHGAGSFCGKTLSNIPHSTLEEELSNNPALQFIDDESGFAHYILKDQPVPPKYFSMMKRLNKVVRPLLIEVPKHPRLSYDELARGIKNGLTIVDTRPKELAAQDFIPGSLQIEGGDSFSTFVGSLINYDQQLILVADENKIEELTRKLMRIGMDNIYGYTEQVQPAQTSKSKIIYADEVKYYLKRNDIQLIDVRTEAEYKSGHIAGFSNIALNDLEANLHKISKDKPVIIHCQSGVRAAMAYSILQKHGFDNVLNYSGGINDWIGKENKLETKK